MFLMESIGLVGIGKLIFLITLIQCYFSVFMSPETAIDPPWRTVFSTEYVKTHLALVALDEVL